MNKNKIVVIVVVLALVTSISLNVFLYFEYGVAEKEVLEKQIFELQKEVDILTTQRDKLKGLAGLWQDVFMDEVIGDLTDDYEQQK